jgi:hypothetical protein
MDLKGDSGPQVPPGQCLLSVVDGLSLLGDETVLSMGDGGAGTTLSYPGAALS